MKINLIITNVKYFNRGTMDANILHICMSMFIDIHKDMYDI